MLVLHDQGGAHGQQLMMRYPERIRAVALCDEVCFDNWEVPVVAALARVFRAPALMAILGRTRALKAPMRALFPLPQTVRRGRLPGELVDDWFHALDTGEGLEEWCRYVTSQDRRWTEEAVPMLERWTKPAHVFWAADDRFLPPSWALRLARTIPGADDRPTFLPDAGHFFPAEIPVTAAQALLAFLQGADQG